MPNDTVYDAPILPEEMDAYEQTKALAEEQPQYKEEYNNRQAGMAAMIDSELDGTPPNEAFQNRQYQLGTQGQHEAVASELVDKTLEDVFSSLNEIVADQLNTQGVEAAAETQAVVSEQQAQLETQRAKMGLEDAFVETMSQSFDQEQKQRQAWRLKQFGDIQQLFDDQSAWDATVNYAGLVLSDVTLDWAAILGTDYLTTPESVAEFMDKWASMSVEQQQRLWPGIKDAIYEGTDKNNVKTAMKLLGFLEPGAYEEIVLNLREDQAFLAADVATLGASVLGKLMKGIQVGRNLARVSKEVGRLDKAAEATATVIVDNTGQAARVVGMSEEAAQSAASGFKHEDILGDAVDGVAAETQELLRRIDLGTTKENLKLRAMLDDEFYLREGAFTATEKERIQARALATAKELETEYLMAGDDVIQDIRITDKTEDGFSLEYTFAAPERKPIPMKQTYKYQLSDVGTFDTVRSAGTVENLFTSPSFHLNQLGGRVVEGATTIELARFKILDAFNRSVKDIANSTIGNPLLHRKQYKELDDVLLSGDDFINPDGTHGRLFTLPELRNGVETANGTVRLNEKQIEAYYRYRNLFDHAWVLKNNELRRTLDINGFRHVDFEGVAAIGKPIESWGNVLQSMRKRQIGVIYDPQANKGRGAVVAVDGVDLEKRYASGYKAVRFQDKEVINGEAVSYALVKSEEVKQLPTNVLHYKQGYVPKVYKNGHYFVKKEVRGRVDGNDNGLVGLKTLRIFDNKQAARKYMKQLESESPKNVKYRMLHDRELSETQLADEAVGLSGGLYTSPRAKHALVFGEEGVTPPREKALWSLQQNIGHLANYLSRNQWRIGMQQRWINTANKMGMIKINDFNAHLQGEKHSKEWASLNAAREYIRDQMRIPTSEERWTQQTLRASADFVMRMPGPKGAKNKLNNVFLNAADKDPFSVLRSLSYHSLLGWFNPAQLFVQAQGSTIAISLHPTEAPKAIKDYLAMRSLMFHIGDDATLMKMAQQAAKGVDGNADDIAEAVRIWKKTGLMESVTATADHAAAAQGFGFGMKAFRDVADKALYFYREGELFTRGVAFNIARNLWKKNNPGKAIGDEQIKEILDHTMKLTMNLTRANRAAWQKGALSIPTQFLQIQTKFLEKLFGTPGKGGYTPRQKAWLLLGQASLYGAAGVPAGRWLLSETAQMAGVEPEELSPEAKAFADGGIFDFAFYAAFGANIQFGQRGAIVDGIEQTLYDLVTGDDPLAERIAGAAGSIVGRGYKAFATLAPFVYHAGEIEWTTAEAKLAANEFGSIISTWSNIHKAIWMARFGTAVDRNGQVLMDRNIKGGFTIPEIVAQAAGFQIKEVQDIFELDQMNREWDNHLTQRAKGIVSLMSKYLSMADPETAARNTRVVVEFFKQDLSNDDRNKVDERVRRMLNNPETKEERVANKYIRDRATDLYQGNPYFSSDYTNTVIPNQLEQ